ncbi:MAG: hypothetical protein IPM42_07710 [Saprospiraceae bacterium]|nr:hypothetical protein [Saprospiraceae bacterium]
MKKIFIFISVIFVFLGSGFAQQQQNCDCPYPIIFVHGWAGAESSWLNFSNQLDAFGEGIIIPNNEYGQGTVFYAHLNYNHNSSAIWGENGNSDYPGYVDDDVIVHDQFYNAPSILPNKCAYAISFQTQKTVVNRQLVFENMVQWDNENYIFEPENQTPSNQSSAYKQGYALGKAIEKVLEVTGKDKVILVAHSMGGLAVREYLQRSSQPPYRDWWVDSNVSDGHKVARLLTVGTPHRGSNVGNSALDNVDYSNLLKPLDLKSEAVRDLRYYFNTDNNEEGVQNNSAYLFGNSEGLILNEPEFYNNDVDCNGTELESIEGINVSGVVNNDDPWNGTYDNPTSALPKDIKYTYYVSDKSDLADLMLAKDFINIALPDWLTWVTTTIPFVPSDGIVPADRQWIFKGGDGSTLDFESGLSTPVPLIDYTNPNQFKYVLADRITPSYAVAHLKKSVVLPGYIDNEFGLYIGAATYETNDFDNLYRGIDEPDFPYFAYEIEINKAYSGMSQKRADIVANQSNILIPGAMSTQDPNIDTDWYKFTANSTHTGNYKLLVNKVIGSYFKAEVFSTTPPMYINELEGASFPPSMSPEDNNNQMIIDLGALVPGEYWIRITSKVNDDSEGLKSYSFRIHDPSECINPNPQLVSENCGFLTHDKAIKLNGEIGLDYTIQTIPDIGQNGHFVDCGFPLILEDVENKTPLKVILTNTLNTSCSDTLEILSSESTCDLLDLSLCDVPDKMLSEKDKSLKKIFCDKTVCDILPSNPITSGNRMAMSTNPDLPSALQVPVQRLYVNYLFEEAALGKKIGYFGSLLSNENFDEILDVFTPFFNNNLSISETDSVQIQVELDEFDIAETKIARLITKWNNSLIAWSNNVYSPDSVFQFIMDKTVIDSFQTIMDLAVNYSQDNGFSSIDSMYIISLNTISNYNLQTDPNINPVCASVGISLSQKLTMTREAFEGTLKVFNGNPTTAMDSIKLDLVILNEEGVFSNDLFEIETTSLEFLSAIDGTGTLAGDKEGIAKILFIPEIGAAPTVPKFYSFGGSISYIDPFGGVKVTMPLVPVTLQVNPSPNLFLHYFLQRDIISDDPLTPKTEPTIPASLAVMIENNGYGVASNLRIQSAQPQVIDNEKGLALNMNLIGSKLQGQSANMGLTNINFGNINPLSAKVGEWIFTSNVLGHFTGYQTAVRHLSSRGNPDLSLIEGAELHEWIKSVKVYGAQEDGINDFLVNAVPDANDYPDAIYLSQGNLIEVVSYADDGHFAGTIEYPAFTNTLHVNPSESGWDYIRLNDPGDGAYDLVSVTRNDDNQVIPLDNAWLSFVTIPDTKVPVYENKFHFVDIFSDTLSKSYTVVWSPKDPNPPFIDTIIGAPIQVTANKINQLTVVFSEPIIDSTFNYLDIALTNQGGPNLVDNTVNITKIDSVSYQIDISSHTNTNGYFLFTVQSAGVKDLTGTPGFYAKQVSWTQFLTVPVVHEFIDFPQRGILSAFDTVAVRFNMPIDTTSLQGNDFFLMKDDTIISGMIGVTSISSDLRNFQLTGIHNILSTDGLYVLGINLKSIKSTTNILGLDTQYHVFILDTKGPEIEYITKLYIGSLDPQHVTGVKITFDEEIIAFDTTSLLLFRNEVNVNLSPLTVQKISGTIYHVFWNPDESYPNGNYKLIIDETKFADLTPIYGIGNDSIDWQTVRASGLIVSDVSVSPDYGYSDSDRHTYQSNGTYHFTLNESGTDIRLFQQINSNTLLLLGSLATVLSGQVTGIPYQLLSGGNTALVLKVNDQFGNEVSHVLNLVIDEVALTGVWALPQNLNFASHPDSIQFNLSRKVLNNNPAGTIVKMFRNNIEISASTFSVVVLNDSTFRISGIPSIGNTSGNYKISFNVGLFEKHLSGRPGQGFVDLHYTIINSNLAPVANAGPDITITDLGAVQLDGSLSNDPNGDPLTYRWYSLDNLVLSNDSIINPSVNVDETQIGKILTFLLVVNDGTSSASDLVRIYINLDDIIVKPKVLLEGPLEANTGLMHDQLRQQNMIPLITPYTDTNIYRYGNDGKSIDPDVLIVEGANAVVDWVYVELFDLNADSVIRGGSYLVQRDGDIVDVDGVSSLKFLDLNISNYRLQIYHRNHLPVSTSSSVLLKLNEVKQLDLRLDYNLLFGGENAAKMNGSFISMFSGDVSTNGQIQNTDIILTIPQIGLSGYHTADTDMNGQIQNSDIQNYILQNLGRGKQF